jgi:hypothetical protein
MSTHIIDQIAAVKFPKERTGYTEEYFMLAMLSGDNNLIDCASGRRSRHWNPQVAGAHWKCLARACELASDIPGGCVRMVSGRSTPEGFIKCCREALDTAPDYESPQAVFRLSDPAITFTVDEKANGSKYYYDRLCQDRELPVQRDIYLRGKVEAFPFNFANAREAAKFIEYLPYKSPLWHHVKVTGPGAI